MTSLWPGGTPIESRWAVAANGKRCLPAALLEGLFRDGRESVGGGAMRRALAPCVRDGRFATAGRVLRGIGAKLYEKAVLHAGSSRAKIGRRQKPR